MFVILIMYFSYHFSFISLQLPFGINNPTKNVASWDRRRLLLRGLTGLSYVPTLKEDNRQGDQSQRKPGEDRSVTPVHSRE